MSEQFDDDDIDFEKYMEDSEVSYKVKPASSFEQQVNDSLDDRGRGYASHMRLPWGKTKDRIAIRPGEVSLWFGFNGHGKSLALGQVMLSAIAQNEKVCVASFEMKPAKTLERMLFQWADMKDPTRRAAREFFAWTTDHLWLYDQTSAIDMERVFAVIRFAVAEKGVTQFVVDNLMKCVKADDDFAGQKAFVDKLTLLAQNLKIHIHLVHHARKDRDEDRPPRKMDALGSGSITNLVDNVFVIWRNKGEGFGDTKKKVADRKMPDAMFICDKQRNGSGWEGSLNLNFHERSTQYTESGYTAIDMRTYPHGPFELRGDDEN